ncbi:MULTISPECIES: M23 family metallopeptidase [unclassified Stenotrophomonas]|uniref:peptidoglycan DD-metalloendopeptidase family protein n=1 Tax=unclassified Stenotrophomonas TaxID=196198 RepID=UPI001310E6B0|nr:MULTISPECIES: M23 family metallopeptidase [unclassified Stenotrophomonas]MBN5160842.1 M23 family metallopeptidase [Stenotrophomonas maltophilia]MDG9845468.1 M23 family metallopeptidase [Stenotrophomonas sp. GD04054]MDH0017150.1 M23 family metallopeptidase [Stenotrophomonas sp. GD04028]MDH0577791.1 M23 family metallopeptidase [Stenotrophomonas sp. GD03997]MDH0861461.1 M23 family metallopeptidase [Stenotrophomonas sp. GD03882]
MRLSQLIVLGVLLGLGAGWWLHRDAGDPVPAPLPQAQPAVTAAPESVAPPATAPAARVAPSVAQAADAPSGLLLPVQGILTSQLRDTFTDARSEGRVHDAIDIMADTGTPVLAVADGTVEKLFDSERGGLTIYQFEPSGRWCYYYAHLQRYADGLAEKQVIKRGEVIGYVGSTGNASAEAPHLHFEVHMLGPERQWWKGESINPYPLLKQAASTPDAASAAR